MGRKLGPDDKLPRGRCRSVRAASTASRPCLRKLQLPWRKCPQYQWSRLCLTPCRSIAFGSIRQHLGTVLTTSAEPECKPADKKKAPDCGAFVFKHADRLQAFTLWGSPFADEQVRAGESGLVCPAAGPGHQPCTSFGSGQMIISILNVWALNPPHLNWRITRIVLGAIPISDQRRPCRLQQPFDPV